MVKSNQSLQIRLTEPVIFLKGPSTGLDFRGRPQAVREDGQPAMVRGLLTLRLNKPTRIRDISIKLEGKARTEWPEGIGAKRMETSEEHIILREETNYFNAYQHEDPRPHSNSRALSLGPGVKFGPEDEQIDDDLNLAGVAPEERDDWIMIHRRLEQRGRNMARSSSAISELYHSRSWHRDGPSRQSSFGDSAPSSLIDIASLNIENRGPSPAYTPTASPPGTPLIIPGQVPKPSSLRHAASSHILASRAPALSTIISPSPLQNNSERDDNTEANHRKSAHQMRTALVLDAAREEAELGSKDTGRLPQSILTNVESSSCCHSGVRLSESGNNGDESRQRQQEENSNEKEDGTTRAALVSEPLSFVPPPSSENDNHNTGNQQSAINSGRNVSARNSMHSVSSISLLSVQETSSTGDNHPVNATVQAIASTQTPNPSVPPSPRNRRSMESLENSRPGTRPTSIRSANTRHSSDQNIQNLVTRPSFDNSRMDCMRNVREGTTSAIVKDHITRLETSTPISEPSSHNRSYHKTSGTPPINPSPTHTHLPLSTNSFHESNEDSRGQKHGKFSLAATLRSLSKDVKERVQHGRHPSKSRTRMDSHPRTDSGDADSLDIGGLLFSSMPMSRAGSGSESFPIETDRVGQNHGSRRTSMRSEDPTISNPHSRSRTGSDRQIRSRERDTSTTRARSSERSRSRARGRHTGLKVLTDKLGLGEHQEQGEDVHNWKEFRKGNSRTYNYPISFPVPVNAPPTIHAEFGSVSYRLKATVIRVGALTPNLTEDMEIIMIATPQEDDLEETENVIVERQWEEQMRYQITLGGKAFPIAGTIPISIRLMPLLKCKIHRFTIALEEKTDYYAQERKVTRHETPRRYVLLFVRQPDLKERSDPLLPIISDDPHAAENSPLAELACQAAINDPPSNAFGLERDPNDAIYASLMEPTGPWHLEKDLKLPDCSSKIKFTTKHKQTNITVTHWLKVTIRVERGDDEALDTKGRRKQFDIIIETPIKILDCRVNPQWNSLPTYTATQRALASVSGVCSVHTGKSAAPIGAVRPIALPSNEPSTFSSSGPAAPPDGSSHQHHHHHFPSLRDYRRSDDELAARKAPVPEGEDTLLVRNIVYDRLISGQVTETGEVPPTYGEAIAAAGHRRSIPQVRAFDSASSLESRANSGSGSRSQSRLRNQ
nr:cyclin binding protein [Cryptococcus depauperatus CBS 7855]